MTKEYAKIEMKVCNEFEIRDTMQENTVALKKIDMGDVEGKELELREEDTLF
ncbi:MAG: hypothetical protein H8E10_09315 [Desulfobacterales bacterium]|nr:hypothetical protein [Desulfobacterales bacterium]MBL7101150.1 hypothetical protein [Desulfobacteraceae bacterium]MBL7171460.1 hypothetical protein [Desulfobacteraceae bacterium]